MAFASFEFGPLQPLIGIAVLRFLARGHDVAVGYERRVRARILFLPNDRACRSVEAIRDAAKTGEERLIAGNDRGRDHVAADFLLPYVTAGFQIGTQHAMPWADIRRVCLRGTVLSLPRATLSGGISWRDGYGMLRSGT